MRIISWNVNGLRACLNKGFMDFFTDIDADIFCVQETKALEEQVEVDLSGQRLDSGISADITGKKYEAYWNSAQRKGYSGTALFTRIPPLSATYGMGIQEHDNEGRIITVQYEKFYLVNVYTPNSGTELARLPYRMIWEDAFRGYVCRLDKDKPVIICGDLNVAHKEIDLKNPKSNQNSAGYTAQERDKLTALLDAGFTDLYRHLYPDKGDAYTWWSYMRKAREKNTGWRIDYFLCSNRLTETVNDVIIHQNIMGSDHCPVELKLGIRN